MTLVWLKALHIVALLLWCAGLLLLPLMLGRHRPDESQDRYARLRLLTHFSYVRLVTPAAVVAIVAGTALIFLRETFVAWMFTKLVAVGLLVTLHAYVGHVVVQMSERRGEYVPPPAAWLVGPSLATMTLVLGLVLAKPAAPDIVPRWLTEPRHRQLPVDETPI